MSLLVVGAVVAAGCTSSEVGEGTETPAEVSATTAAGTTTPPTVPTEPAIGEGIELSWRRVPLDPTIIPDGRLYAVAQGQDGLVALGLRREADGTTSRLLLGSADGSSWEAMAVFEGEAIPTSIIAAGPGLVAAGRVDADNCYGWNAVFFHSADGISWTQVPPSAGLGNAEVYGLVAVGSGLVAIGETCLRTPVVESTWEGAVVWTSPDGLTWDRVAEPSGLDEAHWLEAVGSRVVAIGWEATDGPQPIVTAFVSEDGISWTQAFRDESGGGSGASAVGGQGYTVAGRRGTELIRLTASQGSGRMSAWSSPDGLTWTRAEVEVPDIGRLRAVAGVGGWWVAAGLDDQDVPAVWTSQDGLGWGRVPDDTTTFGTAGGIVDMVAHGSDLVAVGMVIDDTGEHAAAWLAAP